MTMFGTIYSVAPQVTGMDWPWTKTIRAHFWFSAIGTALLVIPLAAGGLVQGIKLNNPQVAFMDVTNTTLMFVRMSTVGNALILAGNLLLVLNLAGLSVRYARPQVAAIYRWMKAAPKLREAKS
jgi:cbb3-type cytochrome oxidase subunit 1